MDTIKIEQAQRLGEIKKKIVEAGIRVHGGESDGVLLISTGTETHGDNKPGSTETQINTSSTNPTLYVGGGVSNVVGMFQDIATNVLIAPDIEHDVGIKRTERRERRRGDMPSPAQRLLLKQQQSRAKR